MKKFKNWHLAGAIFLIIAGLIIDLFVLNLENEILIQTKNDELYSLAQSIDKNIDSAFRYRTVIVNYQHESSSVKGAIRRWVYQRDGDNLIEVLTTQFGDDEIVDDMVLVSDNDVVLSTNKDVQYDLSLYRPIENLMPCTRSDGKSAFILLSNEDSFGTRLGMVINIQDFYQGVVTQRMTENNWVILLDAENQFVVHYQNHDAIADSIDAVSGATCGTEGIEMMKSIQLSGMESSGGYAYGSPDAEIQHDAYLSVIPSEVTHNGYFAIGVAGQIDNRMRTMNYSVVGSAIGTALLVAGFALMLWMFRKNAALSNEYREQVNLLKEKNAEMERLQRQRSELAHLDRLETIGVLSSGIAHEFNNLLTPIMAFSLLTLEKLPEENEELGEYVEEIYNASKRAKDVVSRLSDLSRDGSNKVYSSVNVSELINKALESAMPAKPEDVKVVCNFTRDSSLVANELQLHQMMLNLILNAFQAMGNEGGKLVLENRDLDDSVVIVVSDNGPGIPPDIAGKIFNPFFTTKDSTKGTGLGLPICLEAAEAHGGTITASESDMGGACFTIILPKEHKVEEADELIAESENE